VHLPGQGVEDIARRNVAVVGEALRRQQLTQLAANVKRMRRREESPPASTEPTGSTPMAVSAARTRPCTPSSSVLAMSFISAMVALRLVTIDSRRLVAT